MGIVSFVVVGHVDHGKSTLIGRLLYDTNSLPKEKIEEIEKTCKALGKEMEFAYLTDALEEERRGNITIDTTQIFFRHNGKEYLIIDAPGHKEFLKNTVTGASYAEHAILIVDAEEGIREQTKRHAYTLKFLGIGEVIVAINKMDKVKYSKERFEEVKKEVLDYLGAIGIKVRKVIPISAYYGDNVVRKSNNMPWYEGETLLEALDYQKEEEKYNAFLMPVQDVYSIEGRGVAVGNILAGELRVGEEVIIYPEGKKGRVKEILVGEEKVKEVRKPKSVGLVLEEELGIKRGNILAKKPLIIANKLGASVICLLNEIREGSYYKLLCVTQEVNAKVEKVKEKIDIESLEKVRERFLEAGEIGKVIFKLEKPIAVEKFHWMPELGRFVIKDKDIIIGGGIVL